VSMFRIIVRADGITECLKRVEAKKREGWKSVNDMQPKLDDSHMSWGEVSYVVVMEKENIKEKKEHRFNRNFPR
jgi:hypothetical protein